MGKNDTFLQHSFDNYRIIKVLGEGAFSTVYLAEQLSTGQQVAVKVLKLDSHSESDNNKTRIVRFKREMKLCSRLYHTNIVKVLDFGKSNDGALFTVFEYVPGKSLGALIAEEGALSIKRTMSIMEQLLAALCKAHENGIIHRDLKPDNIMISTETQDSVKLLDFGISTFVKEDSDFIKVTLTQDFLGTPAYSSPEQLRGEAVTHKVDIFAWGLIFIECLTGENAYKETNRAKLLQKQLSKSAVPFPSSLNSTSLGNFLTWVLQKNPERRAADTAEVYKRYKLLTVDTIPQNGGFLKASDKTVHELINFNKNEYRALTRRHISILTCDLWVDFGNSDKEPQFIDCLYHENFELCRTLAEDNGAFTASSSGGRQIFYFGYPSAGDFHSRSAAKSALDISSFLAQSQKALSVKYGVALYWKICVHTGDVTVSKSIDKDQVFGVKLGEAAELALTAPSQQISVSKDIYVKLKKSFNFHDSQNASIYRLTGMREVQGLFSRYKNEQLHGRSTELQKLEAIRLKSLKEGQAVMIQGEAGIGKSRFMAESVTTTAIERSSIFELLCYPENKNSSLSPFLNFLQKYFKLDEFENEEKRDQYLILELSDCDFETQQYVSLMFYWMGIQSMTFAVLELSPKKQKELFLELTVKLFFEHILEEKSTLIIDDLHWIDPTSLELLGMMLNELHNHSCIFLMSARPEFITPWSRTTDSLIKLEGLEKKAVSRMIRARLGEKEIPEKLIESIIKKVDGNPLFAEELINSMFSENDKFSLSKAVPDTLKELFSSRLNRLGEAKLTAQLASVLGRKFNYNMLAAIHTQSEGVLLADLTQLLAAGFVHVVPRSDKLEYVFHHALVCDNAYESMDKVMCRNVHSQVAEVLRRTLQNKKLLQSEDNNPVIRELAHHYLLSENFELALKYQFLSGRQLLQLSAYPEAEEYFETALFCIEKLPGNFQDDELQVRIKLGVCLKSIYGWDHPRAAEEYDKTIALSEKLGGAYNEELAPIIFGRWAAIMMRLEFKNALVLARQYLQFSQSTDSGEVLMQAHLTMANNLYWLGAVQEAYEHVKQSLEYHKALKSSELIDKVGYEPVTMVHMFDIFCHWHFGEFNKAEELLQQSLVFSEDLKHPFSHAIMVQAATWHYYHAADIEKCLGFANQLIKISTDYNLSFYVGIGQLFKGWATALNGDPSTGIQEIKDANSQYINPGKGKFFNSVYSCVLAEALLCSGNSKEARKLLSSALDTALENDETCYLPEIYRLMAEEAVERGRLEDARDLACKAIEQASSQGMLSYHLRALLDLNTINFMKDDESGIEALSFLLESFNAEDASFELAEARQLISDNT